MFISHKQSVLSVSLELLLLNNLYQNPVFNSRHNNIWIHISKSIFLFKIVKNDIVWLFILFWLNLKVHRSLDRIPIILILDDSEITNWHDIYFDFLICSSSCSPWENDKLAGQTGARHSLWAHFYGMNCSYCFNNWLLQEKAFMCLLHILPFFRQNRSGTKTFDKRNQFLFWKSVLNIKSNLKTTGTIHYHYNAWPVKNVQVFSLTKVPADIF